MIYLVCCLFHLIDDYEKSNFGTPCFPSLLIYPDSSIICLRSTYTFVLSFVFTTELGSDVPSFQHGQVLWCSYVLVNDACLRFELCSFSKIHENIQVYVLFLCVISMSI